MGLFNLPVSVIVNISSNLSAKEILQLSQTSKEALNFIHKSEIWEMLLKRDFWGTSAKEIEKTNYKTYYSQLFSEKNKTNKEINELKKQIKSLLKNFNSNNLEAKRNLKDTYSELAGLYKKFFTPDNLKAGLDFVELMIKDINEKTFMFTDHNYDEAKLIAEQLIDQKYETEKCEYYLYDILSDTTEGDRYVPDEEVVQVHDYYSPYNLPFIRREIVETIMLETGFVDFVLYQCRLSKSKIPAQSVIKHLENLITENINAGLATSLITQIQIRLQMGIPQTDIQADNAARNKFLAIKKEMKQKNKDLTSVYLSKDDDSSPDEDLPDFKEDDSTQFSP